MKKFIWLGAVLLVLIGLFWLSRSMAPIGPDFQIGVINSKDQVKGNASSTVILTEYSDFQCPACRAYYPIMRSIATEFGDRVAIVYRHFPLSNIHPNAEFAARAAEAAGRQGKFWEMHDLLFEKQSEWSSANDVRPFFENYAKLVGISVEKFQADFVSVEVKDYVRAAKAHAVRSGLVGTPSFFIGKEQIKNPTSLEEFRAVIKKALGE